MIHKHIIPWLHRTEDCIAAAALLLIALIPTLEVIARTLFKTGIHSSTQYVQHLVLWIAFAGGMVTSREGRHLGLTAGIGLIREPLRSWIGSATSCIATAVAACLAWSAVSFVRVGFDPSQRVGVIPIQLVMAIVPVGFGVIALRFVTRAPSGLRHKLFAASGVVVAMLIAWPLADKIQLLIWPCSIVLVAAALLGTPIFVLLGGLAALLFLNSEGTVVVLPNEAYTMLCGPAIPAIPLFTLAGFLLSESKAGERLVRLFRALFGWLPGGLAIMSILICTFFTSLTGASGVTILAIGGLLSYILLNQGYRRSFSTGLLTANGIGSMFPPSLPVIMYGVVAGVNIKAMFVGALLPASFMVLALVVLVVATSAKQRIPRTSFDIRETLSSLKDSLWEVMIPFVILFSFLGGLTTLVETGAVTVVYVFIIEVIVRRDIGPGKLRDVFAKSVPIMGGVLVILAVAKGLSYYIVDAEVPAQLVDWLSRFVHSKYVFLILLNIALLITGCFMDVFSAIMVVVPLIIPLANAYGVHPVHLGVIFLANLEVGYLTPPVGLNLFLASYRFEQPLARIYRDVAPFVVVMLSSVLFITYVPWITTVLLGVFGFDK